MTSPVETVVEASHSEMDQSADLIHWEPNDPENPFNYPLWKKVMITTTVCIQTSWIVMLSSTAAAIGPSLEREFGISAIESRLSVAVFLFGFAIGPVFLTPLAEDYGRKKVFAMCLFIVYIFQIPCALAQNHATIVVSRLIGGIFGSPVFNSVGNIPDLWRSNDSKGLWAMNGWAYSAECLLLGPIMFVIGTTLLPLFSLPSSGTYVNHSLGWRWLFGIWGIVGAGLLLVFLLIVPETRGGVILTARAEKARKNGHAKAWAIHEKLGRRSFRQIMRETVFRPAVMLFTEPIVYCFALYDGLNYAVIYLSVEAAPLVYAQYDLQDPKLSLVFFSIHIGITLAIPCFYFQLRATKYMERKQGKTDVPEHKLLWALVGGLLFPISLFWFAWTAQPSVNMYASLLAYGVFGFGSHILFVAVSDFTVESYGLMASSAITGQSFAREIVCGCLSLVAVPFYENVGYKWASTIIALLATVMAVFPFLFYKFGPKIRANSRYAQELAQLEQEERDRELWIQSRYDKKQKGLEA